ncbi:MAG: hypothetical protein KGN02_03670 [bacterium]|nr:hypothetical protein [bacterium]
MRQQVKTVQVLQPIATFDESIEAAKIVSRAIEDGLLDDAGEIAEITPEQFVIQDGEIVGVMAKILASARMAEGKFASGRFTRDLAALVEADEPRHVKRQGKELLETLALIPVAKAA